MGKFKTIEELSVGEYKEKGSKHIGYAYPIKSETEVKPLIDQLKKEHHKARHWCYAFSIGTDDALLKSNDDGEPSGTAGKPILGQIQSFELTNVLIVVVRYFGGTKLGTSGLIRSYKTAAEEALKVAKIIEKEEVQVFTIQFSYDHTSTVNQCLNKLDVLTIEQKFELDCVYTLGAGLNVYENIKQTIEELRCCKFEEIGIKAV